MIKQKIFFAFFLLLTIFFTNTVSAQITSPLKQGDVNPEVTLLQKILNTIGFTVTPPSGPGSPGQETNLYGANTLSAVQKFQCEKGIVCSGTPETTGWGRVGPVTRSFLNSLLGTLGNLFSNTNNTSQLAAVSDFNNSLVAYYPLDGNVNDTIGGNNGNLVNGASFTSSVPSILGTGQSVSLNGTNQSVSIPHRASLDLGNTFSYSLWMKRSNTNGGIYGGSALISKGSGAPAMILFDGNTAHPNKIAMSKLYYGDVAFSTVPIADTSWHHLVLTKSGVTGHIYIDGVDVTGATQNFSMMATTDPLTLGVTYNSNYYFPGSIDDVRIYNKALSSSEVNDLYTNNTGGGTTSNPCTDYTYSQYSCVNSTLTRTVTGFTPTSCTGTPSAPSVLTGASCTTTTPQAGVCGSANGQSFSNAPANNLLCSVGTASNITGQYNWTCAGLNGGSPSSTCTASFITPAPTVSLTASPTSVTTGNSATLTWTVSDATSCTASGVTGWSGTKSFSGGTQSVTPPTATGTYTYNLSCTGAGGTTSDSATVTVSPVGSGSNVICSGDITPTLQTAVNNASVGGTVNVSAGSCSVSSPILLTRGISLKGAGRDVTHISGFSEIFSIVASATAIANEETIKVEGFDLNGNESANNIITVRGAGVSASKPFKNLVIGNNTFRNSRRQTSYNGAIRTNGQVRGVIYNNNFDRINVLLKILGNDLKDEWTNSAYYPFTYGSSDNLYFENNTIGWSSELPVDGSNGWIESGQGGRLVARYNTWNMDRSDNYDNLWDIHGFQNWASTNVGQTGTMIVEYYGNTINKSTIANSVRGFASSNRLVAHRGSWGLFHNNISNGPSDKWKITMSQYGPLADTPGSSGCSADIPGASGRYIAQVNNSYIFNNTNSGVISDMVLNFPDGCGNSGENVGYWNYNPSLDATPNSTTLSGIGRGNLTPTGICKSGNAYWKSSNPNPSVDSNTIQNSTLYKCIGGTWSPHYTPYTYPHPLSNGGVVVQTPTISVTKSGTGSGTVSGGGISCGSTCSQVVASAASVTLTANPTLGHTLTWSGCTSSSGNQCTVDNITSFTPVTATFTAPLQTISPGDTLSVTAGTPVQFNLATAGAYKLTGLVNAPGAESNSFYIDVNNTNTSPASTDSNAWGMATTSGFQSRAVTNWADGTNRTFNLNTGPHTLYVNTREAGTLIQSIQFNLTTALPPDTTPPQISSITISPITGNTVSGTVSLAVNVTDDSGTVAGVQYYVDNIKNGNEAGDPFTASWNTIGANGSHNILAVARDSAGNYATSTSVSIIVNNPPVNQSPIFNTITPPTFSEDTLKTFTVSANDESVNTLTYSTVGALPDGATLTGNTFSWKPDFTQGNLPNNTYSVTFKVTDLGGLTDSKNVTITVNNTNRKPVAKAGSPQTVSLSSQATLFGEGSDDPDADPLTYLWTKISGPGTVTFTDSTNPSPRATLSEAGVYTLQLRVTDDKGDTDTDTVVITISSNPIADDDGDGVLNGPDLCPMTQAGLTRTNGDVSNVGCPIPIISDTYFLTRMTNFTDRNLQGLPFVVFGNSNGQVLWNTPNTTYPLINMTTKGKMNVDEGLRIEPRSITLDPTKLPELNKKATLTFYNVSRRQLVKRSNSVCTTGNTGITSCSKVEYKNNSMSFTVEGFSTYSIEDAPDLSVSLNSPSNNSSLKSPITLEASPSDTFIDGISFYANDTLIGEDTTTPYSYTFSPSAGTYSIIAVVRDANLFATSSPISITIEAPTVVTPPTPNRGGGGGGGGGRGTITPTVTTTTTIPTTREGMIAYIKVQLRTLILALKTLLTQQGRAIPQSILLLEASLSTPTPTQGATSNTTTFTKVLPQGITDPEVGSLQRFLTTAGLYTGPISNYMDIPTRTALEKFQTRNNIVFQGQVGYGVMGPRTRAVLNAR